MLILTNTTDKLEMVVATAADIETHVSGSDAPTPITPSSNVTPFRQNQSRTTAATHELCAVPAASTVRNVKTIHIYNKDTADATDITIQYNANATITVLHKVNLLPGEALEYIEGIGWFKIAATVQDPIQYLRKTADQTFASTSLADVTGMGFAVAANRVYEFEYEIIWQTATATVGVGVAINGPASTVSINGTASIIGGNPATTIGDIASLGFTAYDTGPLTTSAAVINTNYVARLACLIEVGGTAGTVIPRWKSETATNTVVKAGSYGTMKLIK